MELAANLDKTSEMRKEDLKESGEVSAVGGLFSSGQQGSSGSSGKRRSVYV